MWSKIVSITEDKLIRPFRESHAPVHDISLGAAIGMFWALTPLVGAQMMLVAFTWALFKAIRVEFNLPIGLVMVWITNPFTMPFFYYSFYMLGFWTFHFAGNDVLPISFDIFSRAIEQASGMNLIDGTIHWVRFMVNDLGIPMLLGSVVMGIPAAVLTYPLSVYFIKRHRTHQAHKQGMTFEEFEDHLARIHVKNEPINFLSAFFPKPITAESLRETEKENSSAANETVIPMPPGPRKKNKNVPNSRLKSAG